MKIGIYAVKDTRAEVFSQPFHFRTDTEALRAFIATVRAAEPNFANTFPEDKELFRLGYYDDQSGEIVADFVNLAAAKTYVVERDAVAEVQNDA